MKLDAVNSGQLLHLAEGQLLFEKLVRQLNKDFLLANIEWETPVNIDAEGLVMLLREKLYFLITERFPDYLNLLYIVDIAEKEFQNIEIKDVLEVSNQMTFLVLKREYQKVWFRNKYS